MTHRPSDPGVPGPIPADTGPLDLQSLMPPETPLEMPSQSFRSLPANARHMARARQRAMWLWRLAVFAPALATTAALLGAFTNWLATGGISALEYLLLLLVGLTFIWISLSVSTATAGLLGLALRGGEARTPDAAPDGPPLQVALLVPVYNEAPWDVFGNAAAILADLRQHPHPERYSLHILSDTRDDKIAAQEWRALEWLRAELPERDRIFYRRRVENTDRKIGNLTDWITRWGARYDAMLVLDADSLMSGGAIAALTDAMTRDPDAGLIQSCPRLIRAETLFARIQQFSNTAYGWLLSEGLARWCQQEGNYWGHNAIIRIPAFAASARLPRLRGITGAERMILSHDFVEAGLMRRAGWAVRFLPQITGSYEETPASLVDYVLRDRRWCQGNLQHLRLLGSRGFHPVSRFHLLHGAVSYLLSPAWFLLLTIWVLLGVDADTGVIQYFSESNPLFPDWPEMSAVSSIMLLLFMYAMLLAPKVMGALAIALSPRMRRAYGGGRPFLVSFLVEVAASIAYAPVLMIQQTLAVLRSALGLRETWKPQNRSEVGYRLPVLLRFHAFETVIGTAILTGIAAGLISVWLLPIALSLALAVPLSMASTLRLSRLRGAWLRMATPEVLDEPAVITRAGAERLRLRKYLAPAGL